MPAVVTLLFLLLISFAGLAEPLHPLRSKAGIDSLRRQVWHTPSSIARARLLIQLSSSLVDRYEEFEIPFDSAQAYCTQAVALSKSLQAPNEVIRSQYVLGRLLEYLSKPDDGKALLRQALAESRQLGDVRQEAEGWYYLGNTYSFTGAEMSQRLHCFAKSMGLYQTLGDKHQEAYVLKSIADMHHLQGNNTQAREELLHVVALYRATSYRNLHFTYDLLLEVNRKLGNYKEALQYGFAAIESAQAVKDTAVLYLVYPRVAKVYTIINQPVEALANYKLGLLYAHQLKRKKMLLIASNIATVLIQQHQPQKALAFFLDEAHNYPPSSYLEQFDAAMALATCYGATGQYSLAEKYEAQALHLIKSGKVHEENDALKFAAYLTISELCVNRQQYAKARQHLLQTQALQLQAGSLSAAAKIEWLLFKVDSAQSHFLAAIAHQQRYKALNDSIFNEAKNKQLVSLEIQYDTHKKEHSIALLTKQTQVQQAQLREHELQRKTVVVGAVLLALLLGMGYNRYLLKQRSNQLLEVKQADLEQVLGEKEGLLHDKDTLLDEKEGLLRDKDTLLEEKEWLLKEVHHRVKNNLQLIISLLQSQRKYLLDDAAVHAIEQSQHRVRAMALIHQKLYRSEDLSHIDMPAYIQEVVEHLSESFDPDEQVTFHFQLVPLALDVAQAVPLGLIVNEAITNALKYAFPPGSRGGTVEVSLTHEAGDRYLLVVADNGVGLPADVDLRRSNSMGANIMRGLSKQLGGMLHVASHQGVTVSVSFTFLTLSLPHASAR